MKNQNLVIELLKNFLGDSSITMGRRRKYHDETTRKAADADRKAKKRAADKAAKGIPIRPKLSK